MEEPADFDREQLGLSTPWAATHGAVPRTLIQPLQRFLHTEIAGGIVLVAVAVVALIWVNSPWMDSYEQLWHTPFGLTIGAWSLEHDLHTWVNDLLMAVFFFVVGLEIKRELVHGDLRDPKSVVLPVAAAIGGMVVPALLYLALNGGGEGARGWGVPMATDIAFAVGVLALVGRRAPASLKVFLLTLAIADDIGAIIVIAVFYSSGVSFGWLAAAALTAVLVAVSARLGIRSVVPYVVLAGVLWFATFESGVHATIAGVVLGLLTPARPFHDPEGVAVAVSHPLHGVFAAKGRADGELDEQRMLEVSRLAGEGISPLARLELRLHPWSAYVVLPLFALSNAGVRIADDGLGAVLTSPVTLGVILGLVLGKPLGILAFSWVAVASGRARLPIGCSWRHLVGAGLLAGIGFTVALLVTGLALPRGELADGAKIGVLAASTLAGVLGSLLLLLSPRADSEAGEREETSTEVPFAV